MGEQRIQGNGNVQIQGVTGSRIEINYNQATHAVPLEPARVPVAAQLPSPARLVRAHSGVVPYVDHGGLLGDLEAWVDASATFAGHVVGGRGGAGKTRLAVKLCEVLQERKWLCGFLSRTAGSEGFDALVEVPTARLVVIDYAEVRPEQVERLLPLLRANATAETPVRALLLVRTGSAQAANWPERLGNRIDALDSVLDECDVRVLEDTPLHPDDRARLFEVAAEAFAARLELAPAAASPPDLEDEVFESPLMVVIAAYLAAHGEEAPATRAELLEEVLAHERRYWREGSAGLDADDVLLERLVALATLVSADDEASAAELLRLLPDLADAPTERRNSLARWVHGQYPGPRWWNPLEPDLVGEHLVAGCFTDQPEVLRGTLADSEPDAVTRPLELLGRAVADHPGLAQTLSPILSDELERLCRIAAAQAESATDRDLLYGSAVTVAAGVDAVLSVVEADPDAVWSGLALMPPRSDLVLSELAATLTERDVETRRSRAAEDPAQLPNLGTALNNFSNRLGDIGRDEEALAMIEEAVGIWRPLVAETPDLQPRLTTPLNNLSNWLGRFDRHEEALVSIQEAVDIWRSMVDDDPVHTRDLGMGLNNLANRLGQVGRDEEAMATIQEAVAMRRSLAEEPTDRHIQDLVISLGNLARFLRSEGRLEEALATIEEAVDICRPLAADNPAGYLRDLILALEGLGISLKRIGREQDALNVLREIDELLE